MPVGYTVCQVRPRDGGLFSKMEQCLQRLPSEVLWIARARVDSSTCSNLVSNGFDLFVWDFPRGISCRTDRWFREQLQLEHDTTVHALRYLWGQFAIAIRGYLAETVHPQDWERLSLMQGDGDLQVCASVSMAERLIVEADFFRQGMLFLSGDLSGVGIPIKVLQGAVESKRPLLSTPIPPSVARYDIRTATTTMSSSFAESSTQGGRRGCSRHSRGALFKDKVSGVCQQRTGRARGRGRSKGSSGTTRRQNKGKDPVRVWRAGEGGLLLRQS